ncbi:unnamed protein product [Phaeothamnion confervicola]
MERLRAANKKHGPDGDEELNDLLRHMATLRREVDMDALERSRTEQSVGIFLLEAVRAFAEALRMSREPDARAISQVVSLWFNDSGTHVNNAMMELVPSYKFLPLTYQISSRIGSGDAVFQQTVRRLIERLCREHPHHSLLQLFALANAENVSGRGAQQFKANVSTDKVCAANKCRKLSGGAAAAAAAAAAEGDGGPTAEERLASLIDSLAALVDAYTELAVADTTDFHDKSKTKRRGGITYTQVKVDLRKTLDKCLDGAPPYGVPTVITKPPAVSPCGDYSDVVRIAGFSRTFDITDSGIHRPKIVMCAGTDGREYRQLVKGMDDLRQDAVMEQVFATVNGFLRENPATRKRTLKIATYTIVPLTPAAGVIEWVEDTLPFGTYLVDRTPGGGSKGAHGRYRPADMSNADCRKLLHGATDKRKAFDEIQARFKPVFRFFFLENFPDPVTWHARRLAYTRSAAVSSIVGYVLGIGDRHAQNILVHQRTAEIVHIDFGVTFEQASRGARRGKALGTPETVPFRLTRDVVDGMGVTGTEGVFRRSCEATMRVLRGSSAALLTILEVFIHDPLYRWMLSPVDARLRQRQLDGGDKMGRRGGASASSHATAPTSAAGGGGGGGGGGGSGGGSQMDAAERALLRIKQKLQGYEDPNGDALSVEGQVKLLINEARNPDNLAKLYAGWTPWL